MTTMVVGYQLRNVDTSEIAHTWGGIWGSCPPIPYWISVPHTPWPLWVLAPNLNNRYGDYIFENWVMEEPNPPIGYTINCSLAAFSLFGSEIASVPASVTSRQFYQAAADASYITTDEAIAVFSTGTLPTDIATAVAALSTDPEKFAAKMILIGSHEFHRTDSIITLIGTALELDAMQMDNLFKAAVLL